MNENVYDVACTYNHTMGNLYLTIQEHLLDGLGSKVFSEEWLQELFNKLYFPQNGLFSTEKERFLLDSHRSSELQKLSSNLESPSKRLASPSIGPLAQ